MSICEKLLARDSSPRAKFRVIYRKQQKVGTRVTAAGCPGPQIQRVGPVGKSKESPRTSWNGDHDPRVGIMSVRARSEERREKDEGNVLWEGGSLIHKDMSSSPLFSRF